MSTLEAKVLHDALRVDEGHFGDGLKGRLLAGERELDLGAQGGDFGGCAPERVGVVDPAGEAVQPWCRWWVGCHADVETRGGENVKDMRKRGKGKERI